MVINTVSARMKVKYKYIYLHYCTRTQRMREKGLTAGKQDPEGIQTLGEDEDVGE